MSRCITHTHTLFQTYKFHTEKLKISTREDLQGFKRLNKILKLVFDTDYKRCTIKRFVECSKIQTDCF